MLVDKVPINMKNHYLQVPSLMKVSSSEDGAQKVDENKERGNWSNKIEFMLSCLSYAVGLGNIWRFPYLAYRNGGGAFLIPYFVMLATAGLPLFFLELSFGQYASEGPITIWKISPLFKGIGYGMFVVSTLVGIYYNMIIAWAWFYLVRSFTSHLPWSSCNNWWNTDACQRFDTKNCSSTGGFMQINGSCVYPSDFGGQDKFDNFTKYAEKMRTPSDEYFHNYMLDISDGIHDMGEIRWEMALFLLMSWAVCYIALVRGIKSFGKLVYFTAFFPYVVLCILLIRAVTLPGSIDGILFYVTPQWSKLLEAKVWGDAAVQIFFSLSPCWGGLITLASYNTFHNNCYRDALIIGIINPLTSVFAGFVIFGVIGFMAHELAVPVTKVATQGAGLAFIIYPEAVTRLPISPLWSILFFVMLLTLGMGTQFTILETVVTTIIDEWPNKLRKHHKWVLLAICIAMYMMGLSLCSKGGMYMLQLMDAFCASYSTLFIGLMEVLVISWLYGADRYLKDIKVMLGSYPFPPLYWKLTWKFITPAMLFFILIFNLVDFTPPDYGENYQFPSWSIAMGWLMSCASVAMIPIVAIYKICKERGPIWERIKRLSKPTDEWGPKLQVHRAETDRPKHIDSQVPLAASPYVVGILEDDGITIDSQDNGDDAYNNGEGLNFKSLNNETGV